MTRSAYRFSRRTLREALGLGDTQLRIHVERLVDLEYLIGHREGPGGRFVYELLYDGQGEDGRPFVPGLLDVAALKTISTTPNSRGSDPEVAGRSRPGRGPIAGGSRADESSAAPDAARVSAESTQVARKTRSSSANGHDVSYPRIPLAAASR